MLRTIASIIGNEQAAQDVAQETFLAAWSDLAKLKEREKFGRWLNRIAINLSKDWLKDQRKHHESRTPLDESAVVLIWEPRYRLDKLRQAIWDAIDELTEDYRESVILYYISGYSYKEISEMLSVPISTVQGRLQQARNQLRKEFLDMVTQLQLEIDSTIHKILKEHAKQDGVSIETLVIRLLEKYIRDIDKPKVSVRQVWAGRGPGQPGPDACGEPSPDGRYLCFTNWIEGNLAVRDLITGECRDLTDEGTWDGPDQCAGRSVWSPDGKQIAYEWYKYGNANESENYSELRIIALDGSKPRILYSDRESSDSYHIDPYSLSEWSQDGRYILTGLRRQAGEKWTRKIALISVADGSVQTFGSLENFHRPWTRHNRSLSPDGRYVVYDRLVEEHEGTGDIFLLSTHGSHEEMPLVEHPADDYGPIWTPDGKSIIFVSDRSGTFDAWLMQAVDGKPVGEPQLVKRGIGAMHPMGFTQKGSLYCGLRAISVDVYVATIDLATGELVEPVTKAIRRFEGSNGAPAWSPDGNSLAYGSMRPSPGSPDRKGVLMIRSEQTGEERELELNTKMRLGPSLCLRWSPDGRSILCGSNLIDVQTGNVAPIMRTDPADSVKIGDSAWSPDGKSIFYLRIAVDYSASIVMHNLETGKERELCQGLLDYAGLAISPDGQQLVFATGKALKTMPTVAIMVMPTEGGEPRELLRLQDTEMVSLGPAFAWTADGSHVLFRRNRRDQSGLSSLVELCRIPVEGGEPQKLLEGHRLQSISVHPDGRRIAFSLHQGGAEVWAMENFLPGFATDK